MAATLSVSSSIEDLTAPQHFSDMYRNKVIVAPMVRVGTLPFRLLALEYGADIVYSEETIDWKILRSEKRFIEALDTTEFFDKTDGTVFLRTCERERSKLVVQLGTSDPHRALKVAKILEPYVAGIDVNMGCPKEFSIKGGMGAALLSQPAKIRAILTTLVKNLSIPVTCKIRILPKLEDTLNLCRLIERCGVAALAVHARTKEERPQHPNNDRVIAEIANLLTIPVIANGGSKDINKYEDLKRFCENTKTCSLMVARAVMWNCSILRPKGMLPLEEVVRSYLRYCIQYDNPFTYTKYTVQNMLRDLQESPRGKAFLETQTLREIADIWDLGTEYDIALQVQQSCPDIQESGDQRRWIYQTRDEVEVVRHTDSDTGMATVIMPMQFIRGNFCDADLPKMVLNRYTMQNNMANPAFGVRIKDRYFIGHLIIDDTRYETTCIEKSRRYAEQGAAMVYLHAHKLVESSYGFTATTGTRKYKHLSQLIEKTPRLERQLQQASKAHLGRNRRRRENSTGVQERCEQVDEETKATAIDLTPHTEVLVETCSNLDKPVTEGYCKTVNDGKRECNQSSPSREQAKTKVFIRSVNEENITSDADAAPIAQVLNLTEKTSS